MRSVCFYITMESRETPLLGGRPTSYKFTYSRKCIFPAHPMRFSGTDKKNPNE